MEQTALTTLESFRLPALGGQAANYDPEEFVDIPMDFPQVKIPSGGQLSFELPNPLDPDDPTPCKTIEGVIVLQQTAKCLLAGQRYHRRAPGLQQRRRGHRLRDAWRTMRRLPPERIRQRGGGQGQGL